ncbi:phospholipase A2 inhibitor and Ly6/PLAUR domain-containing protein isoform X1 [Scophthalmus maximus]|uniref:phospholipase A2 inhibitor and Ly6/PLAUR domain-containing protein isoform X1 n=3 Tax=Scophthalmus maximus TaxID=52904 RepID=UPI001FA93CB0|nr:phospholipase A2 inhibitor and Ly6/PLAUR domain-containing protein isoform X1 [Scophthalmus maximus]
MMKLLLSLTLIWALSSTGEALVCQTCTTSACNVTVPLKCSSETMCITAALEVTSEQQIIKGCASSSVCPAIGFHTYSINLGGSSALVYAFCCDTDNCNSATLPFPAVPAANSLQCYSCDTSDCNNPLQCKGTEDRCFQTSVRFRSTNVAVLGCASTNMCAAAADLGQLPFLPSVGNMGPTCCTTNLCNTLTSAASDACCTRAAMIHLLIGLLVFTLY